MTTTKDLKQRLTQRILTDRYAARRLARLGLFNSASGQYDIFAVSGYPGHTAARIYNGGSETTTKVINNFCANQPNLPVTVEPDERGDLIVVGVQAKEFLEYSGGASLPETEVSSSSGPITERRLNPGLVHISSGMIVTIEAFAYRWGGVDHYYPGGTLDLTSYIPATTSHHAWCKVGVDPITNTATATAGTSQVATIALTVAQLAAVDFAEYVPLVGVRLTNGMTAIASEARFAPARSWWTVEADPMQVADSTTLTLGTGAVTATRTYHVIAAESGTTDDLDTITAAADNTFVLIQADSGDTITVKHGADNISLTGAQDVPLSGDDTLLLFYDGTNWSDLAPRPRLQRATDDVSSPPSDAELDTAFGEPAAVGDGFLAVLDDNDADSAMYIVASNGTSWWYAAMTKAT